MSGPADGPARILITNAEQRSMLATCRSLAASGYRVSAIAFAERAAAHYSRCCERRLHMTDPAQDAERFVEQLIGELGRESYAALIPGSDTALLTISAMREQLEGLTRIGLPAHRRSSAASIARPPPPRRPRWACPRPRRSAAPAWMRRPQPPATSGSP